MCDLGIICTNELHWLAKHCEKYHITFPRYITVKLNFNEKLLHSGNFPLRKVSEANFPETFQKLSGNFPEIFNTTRDSTSRLSSRSRPCTCIQYIHQALCSVNTWPHKSCKCRRLKKNISRFCWRRVRSCEVEILEPWLCSLQCDAYNGRKRCINNSGCAIHHFFISTRFAMYNDSINCRSLPKPFSIHLKLALVACSLI